MKLGKVVSSVLLGGVALVSLAPIAPARADETLPERARAAVERAVEGTLTNEDRTLLVTEYPELAAKVPDLGAVETEDSEGTTEQGSTVAGRRCNTYSGRAIQRSLLGSVIYRFSHYATVCADGTKVLSHSNPGYAIHEPQGIIDSWEVVDSKVSGVGSAASTSRIQVRVRYCVLTDICYANAYPTGTIQARANHTANVQTIPA